MTICDKLYTWYNIKLVSLVQYSSTFSMFLLLFTVIFVFLLLKKIYDYNCVCFILRHKIRWKKILNRRPINCFRYFYMVFNILIAVFVRLIYYDYRIACNMPRLCVTINRFNCRVWVIITFWNCSDGVVVFVFQFILII